MKDKFKVGDYFIYKYTYNNTVYLYIGKITKISNDIIKIYHYIFIYMSKAYKELFGTFQLGRMFIIDSVVYRDSIVSDLDDLMSKAFLEEL